MIELVENRVYRPFIGGKLLDMFNNCENPIDDQYPERWICSTTTTKENKGISKTCEGHLLTQYYHKPLDILVKLIDSYSRLMIQVHPDDEYALSHFNSPYGKTESWYILGTRTINGQDPYVFLGFKEGVTRERWINAIKEQDVTEMEDCLHKIPVKEGDAFLIPGKTPHAMGSGVFFAEVQQPVDITLRTERISPDGRVLEDEDLYFSGTEETLFNCFNYDTANLADTLQRYKVERVGSVIIETNLFSMLELDIHGVYTLPVNEYAIVIVLEGDDKGKEFFLTKTQNIIGHKKILVCYGPKK